MFSSRLDSLTVAAGASGAACAGMVAVIISVIIADSEKGGAAAGS